MHRFVFFSTLAWILSIAVAQGQSREILTGRWRIVSATTAPWHIGPVPIQPLLRTGLVFVSDGLRGQAPLNCPDMRHETIETPPEGLFEGNLPAARAANVARELGLPTIRIAGVRILCSNASFDFHRSGPDRILFALDNVIYAARPVADQWAPDEAEFMQPAWPAIDCGLARQNWERIVCEHPETSLAHALLARAVPPSPDQRRAFLAETTRRCGAARALPTAAERAEVAACLASAYADERLRLREEQGRPRFR